MRRAFCLLLGLLLLSSGSCSLFRQVEESRRDSLEIRTQELRLDWKLDSTYTAGRIFSYSDSSGAVFDVEIVPSGAFTFSPEKGFAGSASAVRIRGKSQSSIRSTDSSSQQQHVQSTGSLKERTKTKKGQVQKQSVKKGSSSLLGLFALVATGLLVLFICWRYTKSTQGRTTYIRN